MTTVVAPRHADIWHRSDQSIHVANMDLSGLVSSYDSSLRTVTHLSTPGGYQAATSRMEVTMPLLSTQAISASMPYQSGAFAFDSISVDPCSMRQLFPANYLTTPSTQQAPTVQDVPRGFSLERPSPMKCESSSPVQSSFMYSKTANNSDFNCSDSEPADTNNTTSTTYVDTLMKVIQAKQRPIQHRPRSSKEEETKAVQNPKKRHSCSMPDCHKSFLQKSDLEIHTRAHTGMKPFQCKEPSCGQRFAQMGNLRTHERRHTGERPYACEICGQAFAQRGNVRAHKIVHQQIKPFICRLDDCGKQFTQLGNLKSHQNKLHINTLQSLIWKFASIRGFNTVSPEEKGLWEYFASLYRNSNKGIKGRGKGTRIAKASSTSHSPTITSPSNWAYNKSFHHPGSGCSSGIPTLALRTPKVNDGDDFNAPPWTEDSQTSEYEIPHQPPSSIRSISTK